MYIQRIQVEEGFLDGLDLQMEKGLNVVIGARGTGKTSLIELIRFCVGSRRAFTAEATQRGLQHALSVLGGGQVTVTLADRHERFTVVRAGTEDNPRSIYAKPDVTILAQGEIEAIGAQPSGRLRLIDRLIPERLHLDQQHEGLQWEVKSLTIEIRDLLLEIDDMELAVEAASGVPKELEEALELEASALKSVHATKEDRAQLTSLQHSSSQLKVRRRIFERATGELHLLNNDLKHIAQRPLLAETWPDSAGDDDLLVSIRSAVSACLEQLVEIRAGIARAMESIDALLQADIASATNVDAASRNIRRRLTQIDEGFGAITRRVQTLRERSGELSALHQRLKQKRADANSRIAHRNDVYRRLDGLRDTRFAKRLEIAKSMTDKLGPEIQVHAIRSTQTRAFAEAIKSALRGSGLHYNTLGPLLAKTMSPLELTQAVEKRRPLDISSASGITVQRASAVIQTLQSSDLASIVAAPIDDSITLKLLDGSVFKKSQEVSIGQRCTIVLPLLLTRHGGILVVDQPEDHLDNSFIASTVVAALRHRHPEDQLILASHNANVPVLGNANRIIVLGSDGKRGFVNHAGPLEDAKSVRSITDIMEGGAEAFRLRANFYGLADDER